MNEPGSPPSRSERARYTLNMALASLTGLVGCLTVVISMAALFGGLWLDNRLGTKPWFTLGLMALSVPVTLFVMFFVVRWITSKMSFAPPQKKSAPQQENDRD